MRQSVSSSTRGGVSVIPGIQLNWERKKRARGSEWDTSEDLVEFKKRV